MKNKNPIYKSNYYIGYVQSIGSNGFINSRVYYNKNEDIVGYSEDHSKLGAMLGIPISTNFHIR